MSIRSFNINEQSFKSRTGKKTFQYWLDCFSRLRVLLIFQPLSLKWPKKYLTPAALAKATCTFMFNTRLSQCVRSERYPTEGQKREIAFANHSLKLKQASLAVSPSQATTVKNIFCACMLGRTLSFKLINPTKFFVVLACHQPLLDGFD